MADSISNIYKKMYTKEVVQEHTQIIQEKLDEDDEYEVDSWDHERQPHTQDTIDRVFKGESRVKIPLGTSFDSEPHPEVAEHLNKNNHAIKDYIKGIAVNKETGKEIGIGKVLSRTDAPKHVVSAYANDPARQAANLNGPMHVVISHHPYDVAGMTSRGHSWAGESCMNFNTGDNRHYLKDEIQGGTHVAYLVHKDDHDIESPLARIAIKPYHNVDDDTDVIFRPDQKVYGKGGDVFHSTVSEWTQKHYPAKKGETYGLYHASYQNDSTGKYQEPETEDVKKAVENYKSVKGLIGDSYSGANNAMRHALKINNQYNNEANERGIPHDSFINSFAYNNSNIHGDPRLHNTIARKLNSNPDYSNSALEYAKRHGSKYDSDNLEKYINSGNDITNSIIRNKKLPESIIDKLDYNQLAKVHSSKLKEHHINKIIDAWLDKKSESSYALSDVNKSITPENVRHAISRIQNKTDYDIVGGNEIGRSLDLKSIGDKFNNVIKDHPELSNDILHAINKTGVKTAAKEFIINGIHAHHLTKEHIDQLHDSMEKSEDGSLSEHGFRQFANFVNKKHSTFDGTIKPIPEEVGKHAFDKLMADYGKYKVSTPWSEEKNHVGLDMEHVPAHYFSDEHIQKLHDNVPAILDAPHEVHMKLHNKRLGVIEGKTDNLIKHEENSEYPEEKLEEEGKDLEREHDMFQREMENHLESSHMEYETGYGQEDDHLNKAPQGNHIDDVNDANRRAEDLEDEAHRNTDHFHRGGWHEDNTKKIREIDDAKEEYENRYDHWY